MRLGSRPCDYRCGVTIQRDRRPGSLPHPEPSRAPDLDLSLHPTLPCPAHSVIMLTVKYREMLAIACAEKSYGEFRFSSESDNQNAKPIPWLSDSPETDSQTGTTAPQLSVSPESDIQGIKNVPRMTDSAESDMHGIREGSTTWRTRRCARPRARPARSHPPRRSRNPRS